MLALLCTYPAIIGSWSFETIPQGISASRELLITPSNSSLQKNFIPIFSFNRYKLYNGLGTHICWNSLQQKFFTANGPAKGKKLNNLPGLI
jgi:hypothetical protein